MPKRTFIVRVVGPNGVERSATALEAPAVRDDPWQVIPTALDLQAGDRLRIEALDSVTVQSVRGFLTAGAPLSVGSSPIPGWRITAATPDAVVLEPQP